MVESTTQMQTVAEMNLDESMPSNPIKTCEHKDALSVFVHQHDMAMCTECFFPKYTSLGGSTLKMAANNQIDQFVQILDKCNSSLSGEEKLQADIQSQEALEDEVRKKVTYQYEQLKQIIDDKKDEAQEFIKNLESVRCYQPLPKNMTAETLKMLKEFQSDISQKIDEQKKLSDGQ